MQELDKLNQLTESHGELRPGKGLISGIVALSLAIRRLRERGTRRALPGVALSHVPVPPSTIPLKLNYQYFLLERSGEDWDAIRLSRHLAAYGSTNK